MKIEWTGLTDTYPWRVSRENGYPKTYTSLAHAINQHPGVEVDRCSFLAYIEAINTLASDVGFAD